MSALEFRNLLAAGDAKGLVSCWARLFPAMPAPETQEDAEFVMHRARTETGSLPIALRKYSHQWLIERGLPSGLPNELLPHAEQVEQRVVTGVGISVNMLNAEFAPAAVEIRRAQEIVVEECYAAGDTNPELLSLVMKDAREKTLTQLFGRGGPSSGN